MLIIVAATITVIALTTLILMKSHKTDPAQLSEPRTSMVILGVQIICGDCSGDESRPLKTYLDRHGNCSQCGGHSYILPRAGAVRAAGHGRAPHGERSRRQQAVASFLLKCLMARAARELKRSPSK